MSDVLDRPQVTPSTTQVAHKLPVTDIQRGWLLQDRADRRSLVVLAGILLWLAAPCGAALAGHALPAWALLMLMPVTGWLCLLASVINHNHQHARMFRSSGLNMATNIALTLARGHSATGIVPAHNLNHHRHHGGAEDWAPPALAGTGPGWRRLLRYIWQGAVQMGKGRRATMAGEPDAPALPTHLRRRIHAERVVLWAVIAAGLVAAPLTFTLSVLLPWGLGMAMLIAINLIQHDGCDTGGRHHSRDFTGGFGNWLMFNNGYHSAHHRWPGLRWSQLPAAHAALRKGHGSALPHEEPSLLAFVWRHYTSQSMI